MEEQQHHLNRGILDGIARLADPRLRDERHKLVVNCSVSNPDRQSLYHLVHFWNKNDPHE